MQDKFLKDVVSYVVGKQIEPIVDLIKGEKYVNEFLIAKKLGMEINQTRNVLYKLSDYGLVSSIRKKDSKKGWYTYFWKMEIAKSLDFLKGMFDKKIESIEHQIKSKETKVFYFCETCGVEYNEENALLHNFTCPECGNVFVIKDNVKSLKDLRKELEFLKGQLKLLDEELGKEKFKDNKKRVKLIEKEKKEKSDKRKEAAKERKRIAGKIPEKKGKKSPTKPAKKPSKLLKKKSAKKSAKKSRKKK